MNRILRLRLGVGLLITIVTVLGTAAAATSIAVYNRHKALERASRYDVAFSANQGVHELVRLTQRVAGALNPVANVDSAEVALRHAILLNRLSVMNGGEFRDFAAADSERVETLRTLADALREAEPLIVSVREPDKNRALLDLLIPLEGELVRLAAEANEYGGARVFDDHVAVLRLHWLFTALSGGLIGTGLVSITMISWRNRRLISSTRELEAQNEKFDAALRNMTQGLCMLDRNGRLAVANSRFFNLFALRRPDPQSAFDKKAFLAAVPSEKLPIEDSGHILDGALGTATLELNDGTVLQVVRSHMPHEGTLITYEDITDRVAAEQQIQYLARHDTLTGLANRTGMKEALDRAIYKLDRRGERFALLCFDLDGFKSVNDTLGHPAGDLLLKEVAARLRSSIREDDVACRLGGDEFVVVQAAVHGPSGPELLAQRVLAAIAKPFVIGHQQVNVTTSIGIALAPENRASVEELLQHADSALYRAKQTGKATYQFFEEELQLALLKRRATEQDLRQASFGAEFALEYQIQVGTRDRRIVGAEALLRWRNPRRGAVSPSEFIGIAEDTGVIEALGAWAIRSACQEAAGWPEGVRLAVNVSPVQFRRGNLLQVVEEALNESGLPATRLEIEITESLMLADDPNVHQVMAALSDKGISIALDDFGTGYSSLSYLTKFPIGRIKIDRCFVQGLSTTRKSLEIVRAISALSQTLGLSTIAEGVETWSDFQLVGAAGCEEAQGYLFSEPKSGNEIRKQLISALPADSRGSRGRDRPPLTIVTSS